MASHLIDTVACPVKVLHRWTGGSKPPVKHPVKDWCKVRRRDPQLSARERTNIVFDHVFV